MNDTRSTFSWVIPKSASQQIDTEAFQKLRETLQRDHHVNVTVREYPEGGWYGDVILDGPCFILEFEIAFENLRRAIEPMVHAFITTGTSTPRS